MTEAPVGGSEGIPVQPEGAPASYDADLLLGMLVAVINSHADNSAGITLSLGGSLVSGLAINAKTWMDRQEEVLREFSQPIAAIFDGWAQALADQAPDGDGSTIEEAIEQVADAHFVHLTDATIVTGPHQRDLGLMRVRLDRVDSWSLATIH